MFIVGSHLGMPISEVRKLPHLELIQWLAFLNLENLPEEKSDSDAMRDEFQSHGIKVNYGGTDSSH